MFGSSLSIHANVVTAAELRPAKNDAPFGFHRRRANRPDLASRQAGLEKGDELR